MEKRRRSGRLPSRRQDRRPGSDSSPLRFLFFPITLLWRLLTFILGLSGRLLTFGLGVVLIAAGVVLTLLTFGTLGVCGVPLATFGALMIFRAIF